MADVDPDDLPEYIEAMREAFIDYIGTDQEAETSYGGTAAPFEDWFDLFLDTGIDQPTVEGDVEAFEDFLLAFYPQDKTADEWWYDREEFYELYDVDVQEIDWEAYRAALGY